MIYNIYIHILTIRFLHPRRPRSFNAFKVKRTTSTSGSAKSWCNWTYSSAARFEAAKPQKTRHRRQFWCLRKPFCFFSKGRKKKEWEEALVCSETTCFWKQGVKQRLLQLMNKHPVKCHQLKNIYTYMYMICVYTYLRPFIKAIYQALQWKNAVGCTKGKGAMTGDLADLARFVGCSSKISSSTNTWVQIISSGVLLSGVTNACSIRASSQVLHFFWKSKKHFTVVPSILRDTNLIFAGRTASNSMIQ